MSEIINEILIEPCQVYQTQQIIDLILPIQQQEFNIPLTLEDQPDLLDINNFYRKGNGNFWVALYKKKVIGTIALIDSGNGLGTLRKMFVHKDFRGKEFGTAALLLSQLTAWAVANSYTEIMLGTHDSLHAAQKFYLKNGFVLIDKKMLPPNFPIMAVDNLFFVKKLGSMAIEKVNVSEKLSLFNDYWNPRIAGELNGQHVKLVKFKGTFTWHHHKHEDEMFYVIKGSFVMELRGKNIELNEGDFLIVPRGVEHRPNAEEEVSIMLFEPATTLNTGETESEFTKKELQRI